MMRIFLCLLVALVGVTAGCNGGVSAGVDLEHATPVTFSQFRDAVQDEESFGYVGSDDKFHYFETREGFYSLPRNFEMPFFEGLSGREPGTFKAPARIDGDTIIGIGPGSGSR